jgi:hypothetical protein
VVANGVQLCALLDSGSTQNFVDSIAIEHAAIPLQGCAGLHVAVANSDLLTSLRCCRGLRLDIVGEAFHVNCYSHALASFGMVLGVQWLESLGPIMWDFGRRTMAFMRDDCRICWTVAETEEWPTTLMMAEVDLMDYLLSQFPLIFSPPQGLPSPHQW